jgi:predicted Rossmann-fold nucleotide-binding protein
VEQFPIVLSGVDYWRPMLEFLEKKMVTEKTIDQVDVDRFILSDDPAEIASKIRHVALQHFGLTNKRPKPRWWLGESATSF